MRETAERLREAGMQKITSWTNTGTWQESAVPPYGTVVGTLEYCLRYCHIGVHRLLSAHFSRLFTAAKPECEMLSS